MGSVSCRRSGGFSGKEHMRKLAAAALATMTVLGLGASAVTADAAPSSTSASSAAAAPYVVVLDDSADARALAPAQASRLGFDA